MSAALLGFTTPLPTHGFTARCGFLRASRGGALQEQSKRAYPQTDRAHRTKGAEALYARVSFYELAEGGDIDAAMESFDKHIPTVRQMAGNQGLKLLIDRTKGKVIAITLWDSPRALKLSSQLSSNVRQQIAGMGGLTIQNVEHYEVARDEG